MNMPETMECKYVQWWLSCHPSVTLNDVMAVLWKCHGLSNGEMLTLTNSPTSDSFHWKGSEIDNSSNIHLTHQGAVTTCLPYMVPSGSLKGLLRSHSFHLFWSIFILCMFRKNYSPLLHSMLHSTLPCYRLQYQSAIYTEASFFWLLTLVNKCTISHLWHKWQNINNQDVISFRKEPLGR